MREFPPPVILDQARERAALRCKNETTFRALKVAQVLPALTGRFARNGGYGSIEESEILNLSPIPEWFGVISGCAFLHCKGAQKQTCRQGNGRNRGALFVTLFTTVWLVGRGDPGARKCGQGGWGRRCGRKGERRRAKGTTTAHERGQHYTIPNLGNSRVTAPKAALCYFD